MFYKKLYYLLLVILPFSFALNPTNGIDLSLIRILIPLIFIIWLLDSLKNKNLEIDYRPRFWFLVSFIFFVVISYFFALDRQRAARKLLYFFSILPIYFFAYTASKNKLSLQKTLRYTYWPSVFLALLGLIPFILQFIIGLDPTLTIIRKYLTPFFLGGTFSQTVLAYPSWLVNISGHTILRAFGSFPDPHLFALYLNMTLPIGVYLLIKSKKHRKTYFVSILLVLLASFASFSRAAYFSLTIAGIFLLLFSGTIKFAKKNIFLSIILVLSIIGLLSLPNPVAKRFYASFDPSEGSNSGRIKMWEKGFETTWYFPLTGVGIGNFSRYIEPQSSPREPIYAHNLFLDFSSETGIFSCLFLIFALFSPIITYFNYRNTISKTIAISMIIFLIHSFFETPIYSVNIFPLLLSLIALNTNSR